MSSKLKPVPPKAGDEVYPPRHEGGYRTLVVLCDGTGDTDDDDISNVKELHNMLLQDDPQRQLVNYQLGIGTYSPHFPFFKDWKIPFFTTGSRTIDSAFAFSMKYHVVDCYGWIVNNYRPGDRICLFGFSRGSFTARSVAAMINDVGLLPSSSTQEQRWAAHEAWQQEGDHKSGDAVNFRNDNNCIEVKVEFVGVWDTVCSVGVLPARGLAQVGNNDAVKTFRHAVALDEHRAKFKAHMWLRPTPSEGKAATDAEEVWFAGAHCDVGGGSVLNGTRPNLAHIPLRWMIRECFKTDTGIIFGTKQLKAIGLQPKSLYPDVVKKPRPAALPLTKDLKLLSSDDVKNSKIPDITTYTEEQLDRVDCLAPIYDQLEVKWAKWFLMEYMPLTHYEAPESGSKTTNCWNRSWGRYIPTPAAKEETDKSFQKSLGREPIDERWGKVRIHRSVKTRMACPGNEKVRKYVPKALLKGVTSDKRELTLDKVDPSLIEWVD